MPTSNPTIAASSSVTGDTCCGTGLVAGFVAGIVTADHGPQRLREDLLGARVLRRRMARLIGVLGSIDHEWAFMISPSLATALLAVDFTVPLDNPVVSAISLPGRQVG